MIDLVLCGSGASEVEFFSKVASTLSDTVRVSRRCIDIVELIGAIKAGIGDVAVIDIEVEGIDADLLYEIRANSVAVLALVNQYSRTVPHELAVQGALSPEDSPNEIYQALLYAVAEVQEASETGTQESESELAVNEELAPLIAVWGPQGAPGRSFVAANLGWEVGLELEDVLIIDADTYGPSLSQIFGVVDETSGIVGACRAASNGTLSVDTLLHIAPRVNTGCGLLSGIGVARRWGELNPTSLGKVLQVSRQFSSAVICDIAANIESDTNGEWGGGRNETSRYILMQATHVVAVVSADPVSIARFVRESEHLRELMSGTMSVVINRCDSVVSAQRVEKSLRSRVEFDGCYYVPLDSLHASRSLWDAMTLAESAPKSKLREALAEIARGVVLAPMKSEAQRLA